MIAFVRDIYCGYVSGKCLVSNASSRLSFHQCPRKQMTTDSRPALLPNTVAVPATINIMPV